MKKYYLISLLFYYLILSVSAVDGQDMYSDYLKALNQFYTDPLGNKGQIYQIINKQSNKLLGIEDCSVGNGANVRQWQHTGEECQNWLFFPISAKDYVIVNRHSGKLLGVYGCSTGDGANIRQWEYTGETCQEWQIISPEHGFFNLFARHSNKLAGIENCSNSNGANVRQWRFTGEECQKWKLQPIGKINFPDIQIGKVSERNAFPEYLRMKSKNSVPPQESRPILVGEFLLPFFFVDDGISIQAQVATSPYYKLRREQIWLLRKYKSHDGTQNFKEHFSTTISISNSKKELIEKTTKFSVSIVGKISSFLFFGLLDIGSEYEGTFKHVIETSSTETQSNQTVREVEYKEGEPVTEAWWQLADKYSILRMDGVEVLSWLADPGSEMIVQDTVPW